MLSLSLNLGLPVHLSLWLQIQSRTIIHSSSDICHPSLCSGSGVIYQTQRTQSCLPPSPVCLCFPKGSETQLNNVISNLSIRACVCLLSPWLVCSNNLLRIWRVSESTEAYLYICRDGRSSEMSCDLTCPFCFLSKGNQGERGAEGEVGQKGDQVKPISVIKKIALVVKKALLLAESTHCFWCHPCLFSACRGMIESWFPAFHLEVSAYAHPDPSSSCQRSLHLFISLPPHDCFSLTGVFILQEAPLYPSLHFLSASFYTCGTVWSASQHSLSQSLPLPASWTLLLMHGRLAPILKRSSPYDSEILLSHCPPTSSAGWFHTALLGQL